MNPGDCPSEDNDNDSGVDKDKEKAAAEPTKCSTEYNNNCIFFLFCRYYIS